MTARQLRHTRRVLSRLLLLGLLFHTSFSLWILRDLPLPKITLLYHGVDGAVSQYTFITDNLEFSSDELVLGQQKTFTMNLSRGFIYETTDFCLSAPKVQVLL